jgi:hypothetical protein
VDVDADSAAELSGCRDRELQRPGRRSEQADEFVRQELSDRAAHDLFFGRLPRRQVEVRLVVITWSTPVWRKAPGFRFRRVRMAGKAQQDRRDVFVRT